MVQLIILRHGKSSWSQPELADHDRPLKKRGRVDATRMGQYLVQQRLVPDLILCSTARRAVSTAKRATKAWNLSRGTLVFLRELYMASPESMLHQIAHYAENKQRVLLIGHNPGLEDLVQYLCADQIPIPADGKLVPTATLVEVSLPYFCPVLHRHQGQLKRIVRPAMLTDP